MTNGRSQGFLWVLGMTAILTVGPAGIALGYEGDVPTGLATGAGILTLLFSAALLIEMLALKRIASGAAIAENITYAVLATLCLVAAVLVGWVARFAPSGFTAAQARMGADLLTVVSIVLFGVYFFRVRRALTRFLGHLSASEGDAVGALDPDASISVGKGGDDA